MSVKIVSTGPVGTCSGILLHGIRVKLVGIEMPVISVGSMLSVVSVLFSFGLQTTEVLCV